MFTCGARHESKGNLEGVPTVLQDLQHAFCMENVSARKFDTRFFSELASVADGAQLVAICSTGLVMAWKILRVSLNFTA